MSARVLVVDDDRSKVGCIVALLGNAGVVREAIDVAQTAGEARRLLTETTYDLMVLDIALPMRAEDPPDRRGGIKLLEEVVERGTYKLPLSVVGLTGFEDLYHEFADHFRSRLWTLDLFEPSGKGWEGRLKAKAAYIVARATQGGNPKFATDICVIVALQTPELAALMGLDWGWTPPTSFDEVGYYYSGKVHCGSKECSVIAAAAPRMGMVATAILTTKMVVQFRPKILVMAGICAGVKSNCSIGDVLVADPSWDWQMGKYSDKGFHMAPDHIDIPTGVSERFKLMARDKQLWFDIHSGFTGTKPTNIPTVKVGPVTSGSAVLADTRILAEIKKQQRNLLGVEMELYGMYVAARDCQPPSPIAFGLKSVCDFADSRKGDQFQAYSAYVSVRALNAFCDRYGADFLGN